MNQHPPVDVSETLRNLSERGLVLASLRPGNGKLGNHGQQTMVVFHSGTGSYGVPSHIVRAIQPLGPYTPLPFTQSYILGVVRVAERLMVVLDIRPLEARIACPPSPDMPMVIVGLDGLEVGLLAEQVTSENPGRVCAMAAIQGGDRKSKSKE
jgi:hypothetical protein